GEEPRLAAAAGVLMLLVTGFPKLLARRIANALAPRGPVVLLAQEHHADQAADFAATLPQARVLTGDVASMHLGLLTAEYRDLSSECTEIIHGADASKARADEQTLARGT